MWKFLPILLLLFATTFAFERSDFVLDHIDSDFGHGCQYYTIDGSYLTEDTVSNIPEIEIAETSGTLKNARWEIQDNETGEWSSTGSTFSTAMGEITTLRYCADYDMNILPDGGYGAAIDIVPSFEGESYPEYAWWNVTWAYYVTCSISNIGDTALTNFAAHCVWNSTGAVAAGHAKADGSDLRVIASDGSTVLPFEIENRTWNTSTTTIWVLIPSITTSGTVRIYYGNPAATDGQNATGLWQTAGFTAVYHFAESATPFRDSAGNGNDLTWGSATLAPIAGKWGYAWTGSGLANQQAQRTATFTNIPSGSDTYFQSAWASFISLTLPAVKQDVAVIGMSGTNTARAIGKNASSYAYAEWGQGTTGVGSTTAFVASTWARVANYYNLTENQSTLYLNGTLLRTQAGPPTLVTGSCLTVGMLPTTTCGATGTNYVNGTIDEWRIAITNKSAAAINATWAQTDSVSAEQPMTIAITIQAPSASIYNYTTLNLDYTATSTNLDSCWYSLDGAANVSLPGCANTTFFAAENATHSITVYDNNTNGTIASASVPTFGIYNHFIQNCTPGGNCYVNANSTIQTQDYSLNVSSIEISPNVTITLDRSRFKINATNYILLKGLINGNGQDAVSGIGGNGGNGGTGGGSCHSGSAQPCSFLGSTNGSNGINGTGLGGIPGNGSGLMPFEGIPEAGGLTGELTCGGGFYATGGAAAMSGTGGTSYAHSGGSGQAIYLTAPTINITGTINTTGGISTAGSTQSSHAGGPGGGEIIVRGNYISLTGSLIAMGGSVLNTYHDNAMGGNGGYIRVCSLNQPNIIGLINVTGGDGMNYSGTFDSKRGLNGTIKNCDENPNWWVAYMCNDEMSNTTYKNFSATVWTAFNATTYASVVRNNTYTYNISRPVYVITPSTLWNYSRISSEHPSPGTWMTCDNGTARYYVTASTGNYTVWGYSLNNTLGNYYGFQIKNNMGTIISGSQVTAYRFSNELQAWTMVDQEISDSGGMATFYLQPLTPYRLIFISSGYVTLTYDFYPSTTQQIAVTLNLIGTGGGGGGINETGNESYYNGSNNGSIIQPMPNYQFLYGDLSYLISPSSGTYHTSTVNVTYTVASANSLLQYWGMAITKVKGGNTSTIYSNNQTSPAGGSLQYTADDNATYRIAVWMKIQNMTENRPFPVSFVIANRTSSFQQAREHFFTTGVISGWVFYVIALICSMLVAGFISRYTYEGAAWIGLIVLWGFTIFMTPTLIPASGILYIAEGWGVVTAWMVTTLATIGVLGTTYIMKAGT